MRLSLSAALVAALVAATGAQAAEPPTYKVGIVTRQFVPPEPYPWRDDARHVLQATIWYPAAASAEEKPQFLGPPGQRPLADGGNAAPKAALAAAPARFALIVLSHGTGSTGNNLGWLGTSLAAHGYVAAAVNHPGNNARDGYTLPGFALWWERARDLSAVIDGMLADPAFAARLDLSRIGAAGFSLGGYTVIAAAGAITSLDQFRAFCSSPEADRMCTPPPEFADLGVRIEARADRDPEFRAALAAHGASVRDPRIRAIFAMAPALVPAFTRASLAAIDVPVAITAAESDEIVPVTSGARAAAALIPHAELAIIPGAGGHYVFAATCFDAGRSALPQFCVDRPGVDRDAIHAETAARAAEFFARKLP